MAGVSVAVNLAVFVMSSVSDVLFSCILVAGITTSTVHKAVFPLVVVAVIVAVPVAFAVTVPLEETVATELSDDVYVIVSVVSEGVSVAVNFTVFFNSSVRDVLFS